MALMRYSRAQRKLNYDKKNLKSRISCQIPFKCFVPGFRHEYPGGGIYRHQFEQLTGQTVMQIVFK
jgi:hypothetical protein